MRLQTTDYRIQSYRELKIWQLSMALVTVVYQSTKSFPKEEQYALTTQLRRAVVSVPSNIAEGSSKRSVKDFIRFLNIAHGSLAEVETQLQIAVNLDYLSFDKTRALFSETAEIGKMINGMISKLEQRITNTDI